MKRVDLLLQSCYCGLSLAAESLVLAATVLQLLLVMLLLRKTVVLQLLVLCGLCLQCLRLLLRVVL